MLNNDSLCNYFFLKSLIQASVKIINENKFFLSLLYIYENIINI